MNNYSDHDGDRALAFAIDWLSGGGRSSPLHLVLARELELIDPRDRTAADVRAEILAFLRSETPSACGEVGARLSRELRETLLGTLSCWRRRPLKRRLPEVEKQSWIKRAGFAEAIHIDGHKLPNTGEIQALLKARVSGHADGEPVFFVPLQPVGGYAYEMDPVWLFPTTSEEAIIQSGTGSWSLLVSRYAFYARGSLVDDWLTRG